GRARGNLEAGVVARDRVARGDAATGAVRVVGDRERGTLVDGGFGGGGAVAEDVLEAHVVAPQGVAEARGGNFRHAGRLPRHGRRAVGLGAAGLRGGPGVADVGVVAGVAGGGLRRVLLHRRGHGRVRVLGLVGPHGVRDRRGVGGQGDGEVAPSLVALVQLVG